MNAHDTSSVGYVHSMDWDGKAELGIALKGQDRLIYANPIERPDMKIKRIEYYEDGSIRLIEYYPMRFGDDNGGY